VLTISAAGVSIIIGLVLPVLYGLVLKPTAPASVKAIGGIFVAAAASLVQNAVRAEDGVAVVSMAMVVQTALIYIPQVAAYLGVWKQLDVNTRTGPGAVG
jgi:hypothetical protein